APPAKKRRAALVLRSQEVKVDFILRAMRALASKDPSGMIEVEEIVDIAGKVGLARDEVDGILTGEKEAGHIYEPKPGGVNSMLTLEEGKLLIKLARRTIETYLREGRKPQAPKVPAKLRESRGVFVTLNKKGELRGCIGHPLPQMPLIDAVIDSAISSATHDPRFPSITPEELPEVEIEVSVLSKPEVIEV
ncbi:unnamed protein product, partial [marine sediment metagenome]